MRLTAPITLVVLLLAAAVAAAAGREGAGPPDTPFVTASQAAGSVSLASSNGSSAILSVGNLAPGGSSSGQVTITNQGSLAGALGLAANGLADTPGQGGGVLSQRLQLLVQDQAGATVYSGPLAGLGSRALGQISAGEARTYRFTATMPDGGLPVTATSGDNAYQGASTSTSFVWSATWSDGGGGGGGNGGGGGGNNGGGSGTQFAVKLFLAKKQPALKKRRLVVSVVCNQTCSLAARMRMTRKGKPRGALTAASRKAGLPAGKRLKLTLKISKRAARKVAIAMRSKKGAQVMLQVTARSGDQGVNVKRGVRLKKRGKKVTAAWMKLGNKPKKDRAKR